MGRKSKTIKNLNKIKELQTKNTLNIQEDTQNDQEKNNIQEKKNKLEIKNKKRIQDKEEISDNKKVKNKEKTENKQKNKDIEKYNHQEISLDFNYANSIKVPKDRIAVIIGKKGKTKTEISNELNVKLNIDSHDDIVNIYSNDPMKILIATEVIKAIARGFNPDKALYLKNQDYVLEIISIKDFVKTKNSIIRLKGRVIGRDGKIKQTIEDLTNSFISVYGKTVSIIARIDEIWYARKAVNDILIGKQHSTVLRWIEKKRTEIKAKDLLNSLKTDEI